MNSHYRATVVRLVLAHQFLPGLGLVGRLPLGVLDVGYEGAYDGGLAVSILSCRITLAHIQPFWKF